MDTRSFRGNVFFGSPFVFIEASEDEKPAGFSANRWLFQRAGISGLTIETACSSWWERFLIPAVLGGGIRLMASKDRRFCNKRVTRTRHWFIKEDELFLSSAKLSLKAP